jgi:hypothetical protein
MVEGEIHFITYGGSGYLKSSQRLKNQAVETGVFKQCRIYTPSCLSKEFQAEFAPILAKPRGAGYWLWKFDIVQQELQKLRDGDIILYLDAGCTINVPAASKLNAYASRLNESPYNLLSFQMKWAIEKHWTTEQIFKYFKISTSSAAALSGQYLGGAFFMQKGAHCRAVLDTYISAIRYDPGLITDKYNAGQVKEFKENRHDQSIFSLARKKLGSLVLNYEEINSDKQALAAPTPKDLASPIWITRLSDGQL